MKKGGTYKHHNNTDVAINVLRIIHIPEKSGYKVKVSWMNVVNAQNIYPCGVTEEIFIPASKIREWVFMGNFLAIVYITQNCPHHTNM